MTDGAARSGDPGPLRRLVSRTRLRVLAVVLAGVLPWAAVTWDSGYYLVFSAGYTTRGFSGFTSVVSFVSASRVAPPYWSAWPLATGLYLLALLGVLLTLLTRRDDRRVTAGLLLLAGLDVVWFAVGVSGQRGILTLPLGGLWLWLAALYEYWTHVVPADGS